MSQDFSEWFLRRRQRPDARVRLFGFPYAGGGASVYSPWAVDLPDWIDFCPVQLPGRETRLGEKQFDRLPSLIDSLLPAIHSRLDLPAALFGHSMGALIAFELARALRRCRLPDPVRIFISGRSAPHIPCPMPPTHDLPAAELLEELHRRYNGLPQEVRNEPELVKMLLPILRADLALTETYLYRSEPPLDCALSVFGGLQDPHTSREDLLGWRHQTRGEFQLRMLEGDHFFLHTARRRLCDAVCSDLNAEMKRDAAPDR